MELVDRYLHAVRLCLPFGSQRDDILRELSEDIQSQIDERRESTGGDVGESEVASLLKARGHPMAVAARFISDETLIGPALYPVFRLVVRIGCAYILAPIFACVLLGTLVFSSHPLAGALDVAFAALQTFLAVFGTVVITFALIERHAGAVQVLGRWDPRDLPKVRDASPASKWEPLGAAIGSAVMVVVLVALAVGVHWTMPEPVSNAIWGEFFQRPVWKEFFERAWRIIVALSLVNFAACVTMFVRPAFARAGLGVRAVVDALLGIAVLGAISPYLADVPALAAMLAQFSRGIHAVTTADHSAADIAHAAGPFLDVTVVFVALVWGVVALFTALVEAWRYRKMQGMRPMGGSPPR